VHGNTAQENRFAIQKNLRAARRDGAKADLVRDFVSGR